MTSGGWILWVFLAYLALGEPLLGVRLYRLLQGGSRTRLTVYATTVYWQWLLALGVVILFLISGRSLRLLGLYNPHGFVWPSGTLGGLLAGLVAGLLFGNILIVLRRGRRRSSRPPQVGHIAALLPRTAHERWAFAGVAATAGVCEEILYRGLPVYALQHQFPALGPVFVVAAVGLLFGAAHVYQGWLGVVTTTILGALLAGLYLATGALWTPMLVHFLVDLRWVWARPGGPVAEEG